MTDKTQEELDFELVKGWSSASILMDQGYWINPKRNEESKLRWAAYIRRDHNGDPEEDARFMKWFKEL